MNCLSLGWLTLTLQFRDWKHGGMLFEEQQSWAPQLILEKLVIFSSDFDHA